MSHKQHSPLGSYHHPADGNYQFPPRRSFGNLNLSTWREVAGGYCKSTWGAEKVTETKFVKVLTTTFDKFHHLCTFQIFGYCFDVP